MNRKNKHKRFSELANHRWRLFTGSRTALLESSSKSHVLASDSLSTAQQPISVHALTKSSCNNDNLNAELPVSCSDGNSKRKRAKLDFDNYLMQSAHQVTNEEDCFSDSTSDLSDVDENTKDKHDTDFVLDTPDKNVRYRTLLTKLTIHQNVLIKIVKGC